MNEELRTYLISFLVVIVLWVIVVLAVENIEKKTAKETKIDLIGLGMRPELAQYLVNHFNTK